MSVNLTLTMSSSKAEVNDHLTDCSSFDLIELIGKGVQLCFQYDLHSHVNLNVPPVYRSSWC